MDSHTFQFDFLDGQIPFAKGICYFVSNHFFVFDGEVLFLDVLHPFNMPMVQFLLPVQKAQSMIVSVNQKFLG